LFPLDERRKKQHRGSATQRNQERKGARCRLSVGIRPPLLARSPARGRGKKVDRASAKKE
jgi:hypothetical protein